MKIDVQRVEFATIAPLRELFRHEARCQIVKDSILGRGLADPYEIRVDGRVAGYGGVWNRYDPGRVMEFYTLPEVRRHALPLFRAFVEKSEATQIGAQTNIPSMLTLLYDCATNIVEEAILFEDAATTRLPCPDGAVFRRAAPNDAIFEHHDEPVGEWVIEVGGEIVATGGFLCHYNPPYGDIFMEVEASHRRRGYGSFLIQELKRVCHEAGKKPAARTSPTNIASRRSLEKAGLLPCARLLAGDLKTD